MIHTLHLYMIGDHPPPSSGGQQKHVYVCISSYFSRGPAGWENLGTHHRQDSCCCQKEPHSWTFSAAVVTGEPLLPEPANSFKLNIYLKSFWQITHVRISDVFYRERFQLFFSLALNPSCHRRRLYTLFPSCVSPRLGVDPPNSGTDFLLVPYTCSGLVVLFHLQTTKWGVFSGKNWRLPLHWGADCPPCTPLTLSSQNLCDPGMRYHGGRIEKEDSI